MEIAVYPAQFKYSLRQWLETFPDKITSGQAEALQPAHGCLHNNAVSIYGRKVQ